MSDIKDELLGKNVNTFFIFFESEYCDEGIKDLVKFDPIILILSEIALRYVAYDYALMQSMIGCNFKSN